ncbi:uncharacterized protein LODBEIA_P37930 [Lodderomyces beijingensis]|uniref:Chromatin modification-related protein n=1 Tax=Lodderomyces beijingensis TaxID=1775926 RepID=A0ABP0ZN56_9ASCO
METRKSAQKTSSNNNATTHKQRPRNITNLHELLPGLNDISDAFEALPLDIVKYFTLLKEIDAKCINTIPQINSRIKSYIDNLHTASHQNARNNPQEQLKETHQLNIIKNKINEIIPCLEEKMHVTSVATDLLNKHMYRINQDYKLIIQNNEIPENVRIGPLIHPAMVLDSAGQHAKDGATTSHGGGGGGAGGVNSTATGGGSDRGGHNSGSGNSGSQAQRSESRREVLAARKANKDEDRDNGNGSSSATGRKKKLKEPTPLETDSKASGTESKKRGRNDERSSGGAATTSSSKKKSKKAESHENDDVRDDNAEFGDGYQNQGESNTNSNSNSSRNKNSITQIEKPRGGGGNNEPTYCYCNQVSFGEMVGCDGDDCKREWFHLPCIGFKNPPKGKWYCDDCMLKMKKPRKV